MDIDQPVRKPLRLPEYNYRSSGAYYVTLCTDDWQTICGVISNGKMELSPIGKIIDESWLMLNNRWDRVTIDDHYVVMPNHLHGIVIISDEGQSKPPRLGDIIGTFKYFVKKGMRLNGFPNSKEKPLWQRSYYDHIIRDEVDLQRIREYIVNNPKQWEDDHYYKK